MLYAMSQSSVAASSQSAELFCMRKWEYRIAIVHRQWALFWITIYIFSRMATHCRCRRGSVIDLYRSGLFMYQARSRGPTSPHQSQLCKRRIRTEEGQRQSNDIQAIPLSPPLSSNWPSETLDLPFIVNLKRCSLVDRPTPLYHTMLHKDDSLCPTAFIYSAILLLVRKSITTLHRNFN